MNIKNREDLEYLLNIWDKYTHFLDKFNLNLNLVSNMKIVDNFTEFIETGKFRSKKLSEIGYSKYFQEKIEGINIDEYDSKSIIFNVYEDSKIYASTRLIIDDSGNLPSLIYVPYNIGKEKYNLEISRLLIDPKYGLEFRDLIGACVNFGVKNDYKTFISTVKKEHYKYYEKFGNFDFVINIPEYYGLKQESLVIGFSLDNSSNYFKRVFRRYL
jgi:hypothetical protein